MPKPKLNLKGFAELRTSRGVQAHIGKLGGKVARDLGPGWSSKVAATTQDKRGRSRATVTATTTAARRKASANPAAVAATTARHVPLARGGRQ